MKPAPFDYVRAESLDVAARLIAAQPGEARILAGGQSLIAMLNMRIATPRLLVDVSRIETARRIAIEGDHVCVGCAVRQADLERWPELRRELPLVAAALPFIGHVQTRSKGTVCGSIAHADPSSELPLCLATLGGSVILRSRHGSRTIAACDFFQGLLQTACRPDELIAQVRWPRAPGGCGYAFTEMAIRHGDFAIIAVAVAAYTDRLVIGIAGAADMPVVIEWGESEAAAPAEALNDLAWSIGCRDDLHATAVYRRHLIRTLGIRTIEEARACRR